VVLLDLVVAVPWLHVAVVALHHAHTALDQPPGSEQLPSVNAPAVSIEHVFRLT
jgi:hypothetical protein